MWTPLFGDSLVGEIARNTDTAARLGGFDPFLTSARAMGIARWGAGIAAMVAAGAMRFGSRTAIVDDQGRLSYRDLDRRCTNIGGHLRRVADGGAVGVLCRNHRGFVLAQVGTERAGLDLVLLSTALPAAKLAEVATRERLSVIVVDDEFRDLVEASDLDVVVIGSEGPSPDALPALGAVTTGCSSPRRRSQLVMLTSGTTGPPKGARRHNRAPGATGLSMLAQVPYRVGQTYLVGPPLFHAWGLSQTTMALATASTLHLRRRFDVEETLLTMARERVDVMAVVPLMLRRLLRAASAHPDVGSPTAVLCSGNVLSGELAIAWMDRFGDRLYNFYGSTETGIGTIAGPAELRSAPGTVGRAPSGVTVGILDREAMPVPVGQRGRVHLGSVMHFSGYTDGSDRERTGTLMATGDLGYLDADGLLHVEGRVNDMIVTGGENVFPSRVEEVLERHEAVDMAAVVGVDDEDFGQRVVAFVVPRAGRRIDTEELLAEASGEMQRFMVPREVHLVDSLPMTTTGKVIRHRLAVLGQSDRV